MSNFQTRKFKRNRLFIAAGAVAGLLSCTTGLLHAFTGEVLLAVVWSTAGILWIAISIWSKQTPFIILNETGFTVFPGMARSPRERHWSDLESIHRRGTNKFYLVFTESGKETLDLYCVNKEERGVLLKVLQDHMAPKTFM